MAITNRERIGKGLELLVAWFRSFVERELQPRLGKNWMARAVGDQGPRARGADALNDPQVLLSAVWDQWNNVFRDSLGPADTRQ